MFEDNQGIADRVDDTLSHLPVAFALGPRRAFLADILDGEQNESVMIAGAKTLSRVDQHRAPADGREIVFNLEPFDRCPMGDHALQQGAKRRDIPLPVSEVVNMTSLGLIGAGAERLVERAIGGCDVQVPVENDERAGDGLDNVACDNIVNGFFSSNVIRHGRCFRWIARRHNHAARRSSKECWS